MSETPFLSTDAAKNNSDPVKFSNAFAQLPTTSLLPNTSIPVSQVPGKVLVMGMQPVELAGPNNYQATDSVLVLADGAVGLVNLIFPINPYAGMLVGIKTVNSIATGPTVTRSGAQTLEIPGTPGTYGIGTTINVLSRCVVWMYSDARVKWDVFHLFG